VKEGEEGLNDLDSFENKLTKKFKWGKMFIRLLMYHSSIHYLSGDIFYSYYW
jgi:hypothetical protein